MTDTSVIKPGGVPIAAQLALLLGFTLVAAVLLAITVFVVWPPPEPPLYRVNEVARLLVGDALEDGSNRFIRTVSSRPPNLSSARYRSSQSTRLNSEIAGAIGARPDRVRFYRKSPGPLSGLRRPTSVPVNMSGVLRREAGEVQFLDDFVAAFQRPDGRWVIVQPARGGLDPASGRVMIWALGCLLLVGPAAWWFARRITEPIRYVANAAQRLRRDPKAPPLVLRGAREVRMAASEFNEMQSSIQRYVDDRTAMLAAIGHDLRTPLSRLRFKLESRAPDSGAILSDVIQMEQMIASILETVRQEGESQAGRVLDLRSLLQCVTDDAASAGGEAVIDDGAPLYVHGDVSALQRLFTNLIENAMRYGEAAKVIVREQGGFAEVDIQDRGPGMPQEDLEAAFRPFYRGDAARNMDKANPLMGVGLGLSIARTIARSHGGDVVLLRAGKGLVARVHLPLLTL